MKIFGLSTPRRASDWYRATRVSAGVTAAGCVAALVLAVSASASGATDSPVSIVDLAVLVGIIAQTVTIGYFAGALSNRLRNLESWRIEHLEWATKQTDAMASLAHLSDIVRRIEVIERRCEAEAFRNGDHK